MRRQLRGRGGDVAECSSGFRPVSHRAIVRFPPHQGSAARSGDRFESACVEAEGKGVIIGHPIIRNGGGRGPRSNCRADRRVFCGACDPCDRKTMFVDRRGELIARFTNRCTVDSNTSLLLGSRRGAERGGGTWHSATNLFIFICYRICVYCSEEKPKKFEPEKKERK